MDSGNQMRLAYYVVINHVTLQKVTDIVGGNYSTGAKKPIWNTVI